MLSIIIPIFNARPALEQTIASVIATTKSEFEIILIDDNSSEKTRDWVANLDFKNVDAIKIFNTEQKWVNYNWNLGVTLAHGEYIAILNSDITLSKDWDVDMIKLLETYTITCPTEIKSDDTHTFKQYLHPLTAKLDPKMINGSCFMFKYSDVPRMFPIPFKLKHWCGDNWLADRANGMRGVGFSAKTYMKHAVSASREYVNDEVFRRRVLMDVEEYEKISDKDFKLLKDII